MKKKFALMLSVTSMFLTLSAFAWTPVQFSCFEGVKNFPNSTEVNGVKIGIPFSANYWGPSQIVNGLEVGLFTETFNSTGLQFAVININTTQCTGMQLAGANISQRFKGFQLAVYNEIMDSTGVQLGFTNTAKYNSKAIQIGGINNAADKTDGVQIGAINTSYAFKGVQIGVINTSFRKSSDSLQFGLINFMEDGFLPVFPFFNFKTGK